MIDFYKPIPFYTIEAVNYTINYINEQSDVPHKNIYRAALEWVKSVLDNVSDGGDHLDWQDLSEAYCFARVAREDAKMKKKVTAAVMWLYAMTAVSDYAKTHKAAA